MINKMPYKDPEERKRYNKEYNDYLNFIPNIENLNEFINLLISKQIPKKHILNTFKKVI